MNTGHPFELAELIGHRQLLKESAIRELIARADEAGCSLEEQILADGVFGRRQLLQILENHHFCPSLDFEAVDYSPEALTLMPRGFAERHGMLPVNLQGEALRVAFTDPGDVVARESAAAACGREILPLVALESDIRRTLVTWYDRLEKQLTNSGTRPDTDSADTDRAEPRGETPDVPRIAGLSGKSPSEVVDRIVQDAARRGATDIHFECGEEGLDVRLRLDGILRQVATLPAERSAGIVSRIKILSDLNIAEHRLPQDGRYSMTAGDRLFDLRVSVLPSQFGEKVVMRLLEKRMELLDIDKLRMPPAVREAFGDVLEKPTGFYLISGPTGSGKTTTLYAALRALNRESLNISTLEDPIEYSLKGVTQTQIHEEIGLDFADGLRSLLRQDPDVILVGEMRDLATIEVACRASLTGHKVLSTIHTNDACQVITRLLDMGTQPHLIAATLRGVMAQRLVRRICPDCVERYTPNEAELALLGYPENEQLWHGTGCESCGHTGYQGRYAIYEYFRVDENIHRLILDRASPYAIRYAAQRGGMLFMADYAKRAVLAGETTVEEIQRVILSDAPREQLCHGCQRVVSLEFSLCPFCHATLKETCGGCGKPVEPNWDSCPSCGDPLEREWQKVYCRHCLAPVKPEWESCHFCGGSI